MTFYGNHFAGEPGKDSGLIPRARANLEHAMLRLRPQQFGHDGYDVRLRDGLCVRDRERAIFVGVGALVVGNKKMAGNISKRLQDPCVANATSSNLALDHLDAQVAVVHGGYCSAVNGGCGGNGVHNEETKITETNEEEMLPAAPPLEVPETATGRPGASLRLIFVNFVPSL